MFRKFNLILMKKITVLTLRLFIVNRGQGLEGRQTSKAFELINFRCWKGTSRDISGASNSEITIA
jgi:hypothetical protein